MNENELIFKNEAEREINLNIYINKVLSEEIDNTNFSVIHILDYENQIKLLQNELKNKNYTNFRILFKKLYKGEYYEDMEKIFYDIIGIHPEEIHGKSIEGQIHYHDSGIKNIPDTIKSMNMKEGNILDDIGSGPGFLGIFGHFYAGINYRGIENNPEMIEIGEKIIKDFKIENNIKILNIDATEFNYSNSKYIYTFFPLGVKSIYKVIEKLKSTSENQTIKIYDIGSGNFMFTDEFCGKGWLNKEKTTIPFNTCYSSRKGYKKGNKDEYSKEEIELRTEVQLD